MVGNRNEPVVFDARLTPHRSLSLRGFACLMAVLCSLCLIVGLFFFLAGAWPVVGFLGLDVLLLYLAFRVNYRHGRMYEELRLTRNQLTVQRVSHRGEKRQWRFQPYWLQVLIDEPVRHNSQLTLRSHGRDLVIGSFLAPEERLTLAKALRGALVKLRCLPAGT